MMQKRFDLLLVLNYYHPHISGLSEAARLWAENLAANGKRIAVVCCQHEKSLKKIDNLNGVRIYRSPIIGRYRNGLISPIFPLMVAWHARRSNTVNLHLPMLEAGIISLLLLRKPTLVVYQCDYVGPNSPIGRFLERVLDVSSKLAIRRANVTIVSSLDYARSSRLRHVLDDAIFVQPPFLSRGLGRPFFRDGSGFHFGFIGRITAEKGLDVLVRAFQRAALSTDILLIAGKGEEGLGESTISLIRALTEKDKRIKLLGFIPDEAMDDFYSSIDVLVLPSINRLEAFGIVQLEAMSAGVPVIASNLPGVRTIVETTGFGFICEPNDASDLSEKMRDIKDFSRKRVDVPTTSFYDYEVIVDSLAK